MGDIDRVIFIQRCVSVVIWGSRRPLRNSEIIRICTGKKTIATSTGRSNHDFSPSAIKCRENSDFIACTTKPEFFLESLYNSKQISNISRTFLISLSLKTSLKFSSKILIVIPHKLLSSVIIMPSRKSCHMPFRTLMPPFTLTVISSKRKRGNNPKLSHAYAPDKQTKHFTQQQAVLTRITCCVCLSSLFQGVQCNMWGVARSWMMLRGCCIKVKGAMSHCFSSSFGIGKLLICSPLANDDILFNSPNNCLLSG